jgi:hypothetical protein
MWPMKITGPKLRHLNIINCGSGDYFQFYWIDALNLLSFEYNNPIRSIFLLKAPKLLKVFWNAAVREEFPFPSHAVRRLTHIENLAMIIYPSQVSQSNPMFAIDVYCLYIASQFFIAVSPKIEIAV